MNAINIKLYDIFRKDLNLSETKARELVETIDEVVKSNQEGQLKEVPTKEFVKDEFHRLELKIEQTKSELTKAVFWTSLVQFLAIVGSVVGFVSFMLQK